MADIVFYGQFIESKIGKNGLTVTVDIERITRSDGTRTAHVTGASATEVTRRGLYYYRLADADLTLYDYVATFITAYTDVDQQEIAALWTLFSSGWHDIATSVMTVADSIGKLLVDNIDGAISNIPTATENADALAARGMLHVQDTADKASLCELVLAGLESNLVGTTLTINKTDGTVFNTRTVTKDASADPITGVT